MTAVDLFGKALPAGPFRVPRGAGEAAGREWPDTPIRGLVPRPAVHFKGPVAFVSARSWHSIARRDQLAAFKLAKRRKDPATIAAAADDLAGTVDALVGRPALVVPVACGHSGPRCFGFLLAEAVAGRLEVAFDEAWRPRPVKGSSHPPRNPSLPPLKRARRLPKRGVVLVVDDLAASGFHIREALCDARDQGATAVGAVWIKGETAK